MDSRVTLLEQVRSIAEGAADVAMEFYGGLDLSVAFKSDESPVTTADRATSAYICERLALLTPGVAIVSEETTADGDAVPAGDFWLVDPLDGTKEFIRRSGEFTINIALVQDGLPTVGVVHVPVTGLSYLAARGVGATRAERGHGGARIRTRTAASGRIGVVASRDHTGPMVAAMLQRLPGAETFSMGSSLKFCLIAEGRADVYLRDVPTMEWDTAAAHCVVDEAGGRIDTIDGARLVYGKPGLRNPAILTVGDTAYPWIECLS